jgi:hypothetical protein
MLAFALNSLGTMMFFYKPLLMVMLDQGILAMVKYRYRCLIGDKHPAT